MTDEMLRKELMSKGSLDVPKPSKFLKDNTIKRGNEHGKIMGVLHANEFQAVNRGYNLPHMNENMFTALSLVFIRILTMKPTSTAIIK